MKLLRQPLQTDKLPLLKQILYGLSLVIGGEVVWFTHGGRDHIHGGHTLYGIKRGENPSLVGGHPLGDTKLLR